ncbi:MAG: DNA polymerase II, partial [Treponema sp.]|nr:DNA polymerase II [Treponema sp.]
MEERFRGFIVHGYADARRDRLCFLGRLEDGRSFAAVETRWRPFFHIYKEDKERCLRLLSSLDFEINPGALESFGGKEDLMVLEFKRFSGRSAGVSLLENMGIPSPDADLKPAELFLIERGILGPVEIEGDFRQGRLVDLVFKDPGFLHTRECGAVPLRLLSVDIETDVKNKTILAIGIAGPGSPGLARVLSPGSSDREGLVFHPDEDSLLRAFLSDVREADPDVLTGWNILDFDYPCLAERCAFHRIPFLLGRSQEEAKFFPGAGTSGEKNPGDSPWYDRRRSAAALVPGRQVVDALRVVRSGPRRLPGYTLEAAARSILGEGKLLASGGDRKIEELENLYREDPVRFGEYCRRDAELVPQILDKSGLFRLTLERARLTGVSLDKAWT